MKTTIARSLIILAATVSCSYSTFAYNDVDVINIICSGVASSKVGADFSWYPELLCQKDSKEIKDSNFNNSDISHTNMKGVTIARSTFENSSSLYAADLTYSTLDHVTIKEATIIAAADFTCARIFNCTFDTAWPWYWGASAKFANTQISDTTFENMDLGAIDFSGSVITNCTFKDCILTETNFRNVKFENTDMSKSIYLSTFKSSTPIFDGSTGLREENKPQNKGHVTITKK